MQLWGSVMRIVSVLALLASLTAVAARADNIPVYDLNQGSVILIVPYAGVVQYTFSFSGSGASISGFIELPSMCLTDGLGGSTCDPSAQLSVGYDRPAMGSVSGFNGLVIFGQGASITAPPFTFPSGKSPSSFTVTFPVLFSGTFSACTLGVEGTCPGPDVSPFALYNVNGTGTATLSFTSGIYIGEDTRWQLTQGTYTINPVPEPTSIVLLGTGAAALIRKAARRRGRP
jgi:hypothetical protein